MIKLSNSSQCTACSACLNICSHQAITFGLDNEGFMQPSIKTDLCVECGLCMKVCPQLKESFDEADKKPLACYAAFSHKHQSNGSSGGMFSALADYVIEKKGFVYGAAFDEKFQLHHVGISSSNDIQKLRGSKYLQSDLGRCFSDIKKQLQEDIYVLFVGTPCQVDGLKSFLRYRDYPNLLTVDLICHGVPSQSSFNVWLEYIKSKKGVILDFQFRKLDGWTILPKIRTKSGNNYLRYDLETYMWAFYYGYLFRPSCYKCKYANLNRPSDITLADFWGIGNYNKPFKPSITKGISLVLSNTSKGDNVIQNLKDECYIESRSLDEALKNQHNLKNPSNRPSGRDTSVIDFRNMKSPIDFATKYQLLPPNKYIYLVTSRIKDCLLDIGVFDKLKALSIKIKRNL